jgi:hypothetical protein
MQDIDSATGDMRVPFSMEACHVCRGDCGLLWSASAYAAAAQTYAAPSSTSINSYNRGDILRGPTSAALPRSGPGVLRE